MCVLVNKLLVLRNNGKILRTTGHKISKPIKLYAASWTHIQIGNTYRRKSNLETNSWKRYFQFHPANREICLLCPIRKHQQCQYPWNWCNKVDCLLGWHSVYLRKVCNLCGLLTNNLLNFISVKRNKY